MKKSAYDAVFLLDQIPHSNVGGAPSYNATLLRASEALGLKVFVLITGRRLPAPVFSVGKLGDNVTLAFAHAQPLGDRRFVASTPAAILRAVKRSVERFRQKPAGISKHVIIERYPDDAEIRRVRHILGSVEAPVVFVDTIFRDPYVEAGSPFRKAVLIGHDIFHQRVASFETNGFTVTPRVDFAAESARVSRYGTVLAISDTDATTFRRLAPQAEVRTLYPIVPKPATLPSIRPGSGRILYLGSAAHHNVDGLVWFLDSVWPRILERNKHAALDVVGSIGSAIPAHPNVTIHGRVDNIDGIAREAAFAINPVRMGSGMKIKMVDYFNLGLGCITTGTGAQGFPTDSPPFVTADDADGFASTVGDWLESPAICEDMSVRAESYMRHFSPEAAQAVVKFACETSTEFGKAATTMVKASSI